MAASDWRLAVDIGGTFTDVVLFDAASGRIVVDKTLTTPSAPLEGVRSGVTQLLAKAGVAPHEITAPIVHATTLITNALIEGKIGRSGLVTTRGFGDTLLIRDEHRYDMYDLQIEFPAPPIPRELTFELDERVNADGDIIVDPSDESLATLVDQLNVADVDSVAICLLNSYVNQDNERKVAAHLPRGTGRASLYLGGDLTSDSRVPANDHDGVQCGHDAGDRAVSRRVAEVALVRGIRWLGPDDAVERRCGVGRRTRRGRRSGSSSRVRRQVPSPARGSPVVSGRTVCCVSTWGVPPPRRV